MSLHWITEPFAMYGAIAAASAAALHLFVSAKVELRREALRHAGEVRELRVSLAAIASRLAALETDAEFETRAIAAVPVDLPRGVNIQKRSEALRMCRRGANPQVLMARLGLSEAEAVLLMKVHRALADAPQLVPSASERAGSFAYSLEA